MLKRKFDTVDCKQFIYDNLEEAKGKFQELKNNIIVNKEGSVSLVESNNEFWVDSPATGFVRVWEKVHFNYSYRKRKKY